MVVRSNFRDDRHCAVNTEYSIREELSIICKDRSLLIQYVKEAGLNYSIASGTSCYIYLSKQTSGYV